MLLLFLLVFNSATPLSADSFAERELATDRIRVLSVVAWPSILFCTEPEAINRSYSALSPLRQEKKRLLAKSYLDSYWPMTETEAKTLWDDRLLWLLVIELIESRQENRIATEIFHPDSHFWTYSGENELRNLMNVMKLNFGNGGRCWLFGDYSNSK